MLRNAPKLPVNATDFWGVVTLAVFVGLIATLAMRSTSHVDHGFGLTVSSGGPAHPVSQRL